jgi:hypothetical protein
MITTCSRLVKDWGQAVRIHLVNKLWDFYACSLQDQKDISMIFSAYLHKDFSKTIKTYIATNSHWLANYTLYNQHWIVNHYQIIFIKTHVGVSTIGFDHWSSTLLTIPWRGITARKIKKCFPFVGRWGTTPKPIYVLKFPMFINSTLWRFRKKETHCMYLQLVQ